jgi:DNA segregation ATPase FtsK/SpoIIIE, S-DNA-T family
LAKRGRKKKKQEITIKSNETKIFFGLIFLLLGIATLLSPFLRDATLLEYILQFFGYASILWGLTICYLAIILIWNLDFKNANKILAGLVILSIASTTFLSFWIPADYIYSLDYIAGGRVGAEIHFRLIEILSRPIEFVLLIIMYAVGISLFTGIKLEKITGAFTKLFEDVDEEGENEKITFNGNEDENFEKQPEAPIPEENKYINNTPISTEETHAKTEGERKELKPQFSNWKFPSLSLLQNPVKQKQDTKIHERNASIIEKTLDSFNVSSRVTNISIGPTVVQYALSITVGTKVAKVKTLTNDLALALAAPASSVRVEAPIPGTSLIGIEIPNPTPNFVYIKEMVSELINSDKSYELPLLLGKNVAGKTEIRDLVDLPHLLVAGATGTGKSVGINSIILGLLMTKSPDELKFILVDPKMVEMSLYNEIPHLYTPVIIDMELLNNALQWTVQEMNRRYRILKQAKLKKITEYHAREGAESMPYIVVVIDEMADLMLSAGVDVESKIVRLAQMSRAVGIHLILATQRPSVNVITGLIKANVPGRMAFSVTTSIDSRVVIDQMGAETLIGRGDMLFKSPSSPRPIRIQGAFTDTPDIENVINFVKDQAGEEVEFLEDITKPAETENTATGGKSHSRDQLFKDALNVVVNAQKGSASLLQRKLRIGYNRAASLIDDLEEAGVLGAQDGSSPRKVLITSPDQFFESSEENSDE